MNGKSILLIIGGGIAAYKSLDLIRRAREKGARVRAVLTEGAQHFVTPLSVATTIAIMVVMVELWVIAWIRARYMDTRFLRAAFEVVVGGLIVFGAGVAIGSFGGPAAS